MPDTNTILNGASQVLTNSAVEALGEAVGHAVVTIASDFGKRIVTYWQNAKDEPPAKDDAERTLPPYAIVGVGRCGSHISAELARMLIANTPGDAAERSNKSFNWVASLFGHPET